MADFTIKQNDPLPALVVTLKTNGIAVNLTTATGIEFHMLAAGAGSPKVNAAAEIVSAATGIVRYMWAGLDTDTAGDYVGEFEVMWPDAKPQTWPNGSNFSIQIFDDIA